MNQVYILMSLRPSYRVFTYLQKARTLSRIATENSKRLRVYVVDCPPSLCPNITERSIKFNEELASLNVDEVNTYFFVLHHKRMGRIKRPSSMI